MSALISNATSITQQCELFLALDSVRKEMKEVLDDGWDFPKIIVFGAESAGKSTILERIAMLPIFPEGDDTCTRSLVEVRLRYDGGAVERKVDICVLNGDGKKAGGYDSYDDYPIDNCKTLVRDFMEKVSTKDENQDDKKKGICLDKTVVIELRGKDLPNLDLLDLPGIKQEARKGESDSVVTDTQKLVEDTIDKLKGMAIFLAIRDARSDLLHDVSAANTIKIVKDKNIGANTIGVLTKCDKMDEDDIDHEQRGVVYKLDQKDAVELKFPLLNMYIATSNRPPKGGPKETSHRNKPNKKRVSLSLNDLKAFAETEEKWFIDNGLSELVGDKRATTNVLVEKVSERYMEFVEKTWLPKTISKLCAKFQEYIKQNEKLGLPSTHGEHQLNPDLAESFSIKDLVGGTSELSSPPFDPAVLSKTVANKLSERFNAVEYPNLFNNIAKEELKKLSEDCTAAFGGVRTASDFSNLQVAMMGIASVLNGHCDSAIDKIERKLSGGPFVKYLENSRFPKLQEKVKEVLGAKSKERTSEARKKVGEIIKKHVDAMVPEYDFSSDPVKGMVKRNRGGGPFDFDLAVTEIVYVLSQEMLTNYSVEFQKLEGAVKAMNQKEDWIESCADEREEIYRKIMNAIPGTFKTLSAKFGDDAVITLLVVQRTKP